MSGTELQNQEEEKEEEERGGEAEEARKDICALIKPPLVSLGLVLLDGSHLDTRDASIAEEEETPLGELCRESSGRAQGQRRGVLRSSM